MFAFAIPIYAADFSAYSDIARIGPAARIDLMVVSTIRTARTPRDFWRRWHISLELVPGDHVYILLGGSRGGEWHHARNVIVTFLPSGRHGASWNYVLWASTTVLP
ncbi:MAG: MBOAT family O-acyltransferase [Vicinamibacterales bacterium]